MANNLSVKDSTGATQTVKTTDNGGVHTPHHNIDTLPSLPAGSNTIGNVGLTGTVPLPTGAATEATLLNIKTGTDKIPASPATAAKQPALGTAGAASTDVLTVQGIAGAVPLPVAGTTVASAVLLTRPADTTAYAANDTVSNSTSSTTPLTLAGVARVNGGSGYLTRFSLWTNQSTNTARFKIHFYSVVNPTVAADNAAFTLLWANRAVKIGSVLLPAMTTEGSGSDTARAVDYSTRLPFLAAGGDTALYAVLETLDAFTPTSGQLFYLAVTAEQN